MVMCILPFYGTIALILHVLQPTNAIINETFNGYLFTIPDSPEANLMTQGNANRWCQTNKNTLLEIHNSRTQGIVVQYITWKNGPNTILGYNRQLFTNGTRNSASHWMWVNWQRYVGSSVINQQNADYSYGYLGFKAQNQPGFSFVADNQPINYRGYICEDATTTTCTNGFEHNDRCYISSTEQMSWFGARNRCLDGGGDLASFDFVNNTQSLSIFNESWINPSNSYWIGLRRQWWSWQGSGSEIKYTNWKAGHPLTFSQSSQPAYNCLCLMSPQRDWSECNCNENSQFICARAVNDTSTAATPSATLMSTSLNFPLSPTPTSSPFSIGKENTSPIKFSPAKGNETTSDSLVVPLGVGLGVGLGGLLIIIIIIVVVVVLIRKRRTRKFGNSHNQKRFQTPDILNIAQEDKYVTVERKLDYGDADLKTNDMKTIYAVVQPTTNNQTVS